MIPFADFQWFSWCLVITILATACLYASRSPRIAATVLTTLFFAIWFLLDRQETLRFCGFIAYEWLVAEVALLATRWSSHRKLVCSLCIAAALVPIFMLKLHFLVMVGVSYVTFRSVQVLIDMYDGRLKRLSRLDYLLFLVFFPTIFAGPIDRFERFSRDLSEKLSTRDVALRLEDAAKHLWWGLAYKFVVAHGFMYILENRATLLPWGTVVQEASYFYLYGGYLVADFAGYSAIVIAVSLAVGVRTPENVDRPFLSTSIREFWQRMHITLSLWFRDYVFLRLVLFLRRRRIIQSTLLASVFSLFVSFGLMGVWHGLAPNYIGYGLYHAALLAVQEIWDDQRRKKRFTWVPPTWLSWLVTFHLLLLGFAIFSGYVPGFWRLRVAGQGMLDMFHAIFG